MSCRLVVVAWSPEVVQETVELFPFPRKELHPGNYAPVNQSVKLSSMVLSLAALVGGPLHGLARNSNSAFVIPVGKPAKL